MIDKILAFVSMGSLIGFVAIVAIPAVIGEVWLAIWLLARGGKRGPNADVDTPTEAGRGLAAVGS